jgi:hypothetical protein
MATRVEELQAEVAQLRAALEPFAKMAGKIPVNVGNYNVWRLNGVSVTVDDFRQAAVVTGMPMSYEKGEGQGEALAVPA